MVLVARTAGLAFGPVQFRLSPVNSHGRISAVEIIAMKFAFARSERNRRSDDRKRADRAAHAPLSHVAVIGRLARLLRFRSVVSVGCRNPSGPIRTWPPTGTTRRSRTFGRRSLEELNRQFRRVARRTGSGRGARFGAPERRWDHRPLADLAARRVRMHEPGGPDAGRLPKEAPCSFRFANDADPPLGDRATRAVAGHFPSGPTWPQRQRADVIGSEGLAESVRPARRNWSVTEERALRVLEIDVSVVCPGRARRRHRDTCGWRRRPPVRS